MVEGASGGQDMRRVRLQAEALTAVAKGQQRLAPSTIGSTPGFRRARPTVPLTPLRGGGSRAGLFSTLLGSSKCLLTGRCYVTRSG